ncbi:MAG TPA: hypothetical protein VFJ58_21215 [Armatimonadota bacterium]|nr:hypothetical protein [Armatimonadota bacterium]
MTYDAAYRRIALADGNGRVTTYTYSDAGSLASVSYPGHNGVYDTLQFTSDPDGNVTKWIDGRGVEADFAYADPENLLTDTTYPANPSLNVHNSYDGYGRLEGQSDGSGAAAFTYDDLDETLTTQTTYTGLPTQTISYAYYPDGHRESMTTPAGVFQYSYDANARLASLQNPLNEVFNWTYQDDGRLATRQLPNGAEAAYTFNPRGFLTDLTNTTGGGATLSDFGSMVYDGVGALTSLTTSIPGYSTYGGVTTYSYSSSGQLLQEKSARHGGYTDKFAYDSAGNPSTFRGVTRAYNNRQPEPGVHVRRRWQPRLLQRIDADLWPRGSPDSVRKRPHSRLHRRWPASMEANRRGHNLLPLRRNKPGL